MYAQDLHQFMHFNYSPLAEAAASAVEELCQPSFLHQQWHGEQQVMAHFIVLRIAAVD